jgi:hypothetical protein
VVVDQELNEQQRNIRRQTAGLEASKMAARCVNDSWSVFNKLTQIKEPPFLVETYGGAFLGAEMVHVGDAIRVDHADATTGETSTAIMRVDQIRAKIYQGLSQSRSLEMMGHTYRLVRGNVQGVPPASLGPYFEEEVGGRNQIDRSPTGPWNWVLLQPNVVCTEGDIQGRSYVSHKLMSIVDAAKFEADRARGEFRDATTSLNKRGQGGSNGTKYVGCQSSRRNTFGDSVAEQVQLPATIKENFPG